MSSQFRIEEFPASSEIFTLLNITKIKSNEDNISFIVHPVPAPCSTKALANNKISDGGNNQKLMLFNRGNAISGAPICTGTK
jgi:hypothetical protein